MLVPCVHSDSYDSYTSIHKQRGLQVLNMSVKFTLVPDSWAVQSVQVPTTPPTGLMHNAIIVMVKQATCPTSNLQCRDLRWRCKRDANTSIDRSGSCNALATCLSVTGLVMHVKGSVKAKKTRGKERKAYRHARLCASPRAEPRLGLSKYSTQIVPLQMLEPGQFLSKCSNQTILLQALNPGCASPCARPRLVYGKSRCHGGGSQTSCRSSQTHRSSAVPQDLTRCAVEPLVQFS